MSFKNLFKSLTMTSSRQRPTRRPSSARLNLEPLEDRWLPSGYTFTDLGTLDGLPPTPFSQPPYPSDINAFGQIVGSAPTSAGDLHDFVWNNGTMTDLGTYGGASNDPVAINNGGQVAGTTLNAAGDRRAFLVTPEDTNGDGSPDLWYRDTNGDGVNDLNVDLGTFGGDESMATDVNNLGQVVGWSTTALGDQRAFLWQNGTMTDLGGFAGLQTTAKAINDAGQIVGYFHSGFDGPTSGLSLWHNGVATILDVPNHHFLVDMNAGGQILFSDTPGIAGDNSAQLWTPTVPNGTSGTLVVLPFGAYRGYTEAYGLNNLGEVVGLAAEYTDDGGGGGFYEYTVLWRNGVMYNINGYNEYTNGLRHAAAINDAGEIVGYGNYGGGDHAYLLIPNPPQLTIGDVTVTEGNSSTPLANFTVTLSEASRKTVTVGYATANGTAMVGSDYQSASGSLTFAPGQTSKTITIQVTGDRLPEPNETFTINLSAPTNATIADGQGIGTIMDDEPRISISDVTKKEGNGKKTTLFTFTVTLSAAYDQPVTMSYATVNGTATTSDGDYIAKTGTLTFAPGETTKTLTIEVKGDSKKEANETFYLDLFGNSGNSLFTKNRGIGTILNDD